MMREDWATVPLGELLTKYEEWTEIEPSEKYRQVTVRYWGQGVVLRDEVAGAKFKTKRQRVARAEQFIMSKIDARHGALGLVPDSLDGAVVSADFPVFTINHSRLLPKFFEWMTKTRWFVNQCLVASEGTTRRVRLKEEQLLTFQIPLSPLSEQRRIVARIEELAAKVEEARGLRITSSQVREALITSLRTKAFMGELSKSWRVKHHKIQTAGELLEEVASQRWEGHAKSRKRKPISLPEPPDVPASWCIVTAGELQEIGAILDIQDGNHGSNYPRKHEFGNKGVPFVTAVQMEGHFVNIPEAPRLPEERAARLRIGFARAGDVLLTHNASVGKVARAPQDAGNFLIGTSVTYYRLILKQSTPTTSHTTSDLNYFSANYIGL